MVLVSQITQLFQACVIEVDNISWRISG